jgi:hypothetical protein
MVTPRRKVKREESRKHQYFLRGVIRQSSVQ